MTKKTQEETQDNILAEELAEEGLAGIFMKAGTRSSMTVTCRSTGLPRLDKILHEAKLGLPEGRHIEISSKVPEVGKTSIALDILREWQRQGAKSAIADIEDTLDNDFLEQQGIIIDPDKAPEGIYVPYIAKIYDEETGKMRSAEEMLDAIEKISKIVDLVVVDSLPGLARKSELEKDAMDSSQPGGIGKLMFEHVRKTANKKATIIWINQFREQIGGYNPTGQKRWKTSGGDAIPFFGSIRMELTLVEKLTTKVNGVDEVYGIKVKVYTNKNKVSPPYRDVTLTYINGRGFCPVYDVFELAKNKGIINKPKGSSWITFGDTKIQGDLEFYNKMVAEPELYQAVQEALQKEE